jgi:hypothetical protein
MSTEHGTSSRPILGASPHVPVAVGGGASNRKRVRTLMSPR